MTREDAIKRLETHIAYHQSGAWPFTKTDEAMDMAIAALRKQDTKCSEAVTKWISVEERLPQETGEVCRVVNLMMDNGLVTAGWLNDITGFGYFLDSRSSFIRQAPISRFTHWMPLPEPPEVEV